MNPTDEVVAKTERPEMAGFDDWLSKFDERFRAALKDVQRQRPLPKQVEDLLSQSSQHFDDEASERTIIRRRLLAIENEMQKRGARGFARYLIAICVGAAVIRRGNQAGNRNKGSGTWLVTGDQADDRQLGAAVWLDEAPGRCRKHCCSVVRAGDPESAAVRGGHRRGTKRWSSGFEQQSIEQLATRQDQWAEAEQ